MHGALQQNIPSLEFFWLWYFIDHFNPIHNKNWIRNASKSKIWSDPLQIWKTWIAGSTLDALGLALVNDEVVMLAALTSEFYFMPSDPRGRFPNSFKTTYRYYKYLLKNYPWRLFVFCAISAGQAWLGISEFIKLLCLIQ